MNAQTHSQFVSLEREPPPCKRRFGTSFRTVLKQELKG